MIEIITLLESPVAYDLHIGCAEFDEEPDREDHRAADPNPFAFGSGDLVADPFANDLALELGEGEQDIAVLASLIKIRNCCRGFLSGTPGGCAPALSLTDAPFAGLLARTSDVNVS